jgi:hypothetical protein
MTKKGTAEKRDLKSSSSTVEFNYGAHNESYWSYIHMVLQLEDSVDCIQVLAQNLDYLFLLDHSCGHGKQREGRLNAEKMSKNWGKTSILIYDNVIKENKGYLGPFPKML